MENRGFWRFEGVSDSALQRELVELLASSHRTEARIVAHIAEVDRRSLFLKEGFSSLYKYCQFRLGLSENESFHRMTAAAIARQYPVAFALIEQRKIHLSGLCMLRHFLTPANHQELLRAACGKTKRRVEEMLAARFPGRSVPDSMRRLPRARGRVLAVIAPPEPSRPVATPPSAESVVRSERPESVVPFGDAKSEVALSGNAGVDVVDPVTGEVTRRQPERSTSSTLPIEPSLPEQSAPPRYRVQFDASSTLKTKIDWVKALDSHANPKCDLERLFERALDVYIEHLQRKRFGKTDRPRRAAKAPREDRSRRLALRARPSAAVAAVAAVDGVPEGTTATGQAREPSHTRREHIPHETRRSVTEKDGLRCSFVSATGQRCEERSFLQFHHQEPWARTQDDRSENLHLYCSAHNRFRAEQDFGVEHIARRIEHARQRRRPEP